MLAFCLTWHWERASCAEVLRRFPNVDVQRVDFAQSSFAEQMQLVAQSEVLVGMHGAGLAHLLWLPEHGGLLELRPKRGMGWFCFVNMARSSSAGCSVTLWENIYL